MKRYLMKRFALTEKGAADMIKAIAAVTVSNIALMTPVWLLFAFTGDYLAGTAAGRWVTYLLFAAACLAVIFLPNIWQYNATFFATYIESGKRKHEDKRIWRNKHEFLPGDGRSVNRSCC